MDSDRFSTVLRVVAGLIAGVAALVGALAIVRGLRRGAADRELARTGARTSGEIVDNRVHSGTEGGMTFSPVVRFTDSTGREQVVAGEERVRTSWVTGTTVQVLYDPQRPDRVRVGTSGSGSSVAVVFGVVFLAFAAAVVLGVGATVGWTGGSTGPVDVVPDGGPGGPPPGFDQPPPGNQVDSAQPGAAQSGAARSGAARSGAADRRGTTRGCEWWARPAFNSAADRVHDDAGHDRPRVPAARAPRPAVQVTRAACSAGEWRSELAERGEIATRPGAQVVRVVRGEFLPTAITSTTS